MRNPTNIFTKRPGFTLIELLVVVAIIALLIAILLPSLAKARDNAKTAVCATNLRQIGISYLMYCNDKNNGRTNITSTSEAGSFWMALTQPYHSDDTKVYYCPKATDPAIASLDQTSLRWGSISAVWDGTQDSGKWDKAVVPGSEGKAASSAANPDGYLGWTFSGGVVTGTGDLASAGTGNYLGYKSSYTNNAWMDNNSNPSGGGSRIKVLADIEAPVMTPFFSDGNWANTSGANNAGSSQVVTSSITWSSGGGIYPGVMNSADDLNGGHTTDSLQRVLLDRHSKAININFGDGSTRLVKLRDLWTVNWFQGWRTPNGSVPVPLK